MQRTKTLVWLGATALTLGLFNCAGATDGSSSSSSSSSSSGGASSTSSSTTSSSSSGGVTSGTPGSSSAATSGTGSSGNASSTVPASSGTPASSMGTGSSTAPGSSGTQASSAGTGSSTGAGSSSGADVSSGGQGSSTGEASSGTTASSTGSTASSMGQAPLAPSVDVLNGGNYLYSPLHVTGQAATPPSQGDTVRVRIFDTTTMMQLGEATVALGPQGGFALDVTYMEPAGGQYIRAEVVHVGQGVESPVTSKEGKQASSQDITFNITQQADGSSLAGTKVVVGLFAHADDVLNPFRTGTVDVVDGMLATGSVTLRVPEGGVHVRAFRDSNQNGLPNTSTQSGAEAQSTTDALQVFPGSAPVDLSLRAPDLATHGTWRLDARTVNASAQGAGPGCRGYSLRVIATWVSMQGPGSAPGQAPAAKLPDGRWVTPMDDGACGNRYDGPNTSDSFDRNAADGTYTFGIRDPGTNLQGTFLLPYRSVAGDFVDVASDTVDQLVQLPTVMTTTSPQAGMAFTSPAAALAWNAVPGATHYRVSLSNQSNPVGAGGGGEVDSASWTPMSPLSDGNVYSFTVSPVRKDPNAPMGVTDVEAETLGAASISFPVATSPDAIITVAGTLANDSGRTGPIRLEASGCQADATTGSDPTCMNTAQVQVTMAPGTTNFFLQVFKAQGAGHAYVRAQLLVDPPAPGQTAQDPRAAESKGLDGKSNIGPVALTFFKPLRLVSPAQLMTVGGMLVMTWEDWHATPGAEPAQWSYAVFASAANGAPGAPPALVRGLPITQMSFDMGMPAGTVDLLALSSAGMFPSVAALNPGEWDVGVAIIPCGFDAPDYAACVAPVLSGGASPAVQSQVRVTVGP